MRLTFLLLVIAALGMMAGAALVGMWLVGLAIMADSAGLAAFALLRNIPDRPAPVTQTLPDILERVRQAR